MGGVAPFVPTAATVVTQLIRYRPGRCRLALAALPGGSQRGGVGYRTRVLRQTGLACTQTLTTKAPPWVVPDRASKGCYTQDQLRSIRPGRYAPIRGFAPVVLSSTPPALHWGFPHPMRPSTGSSGPSASINTRTAVWRCGVLRGDNPRQQPGDRESPGGHETATSQPFTSALALPTPASNRRECLDRSASGSSACERS